MRIIRFLDEQARVRYGADLSDDGTAELLEGDPLKGERLAGLGQRVSVTKRLSPIEPRAIMCIGLNYRQHAEETGSELPERPVLFMKNPASVNHPNTPIVIPAVCHEPPQVDYEVELAVVIGRPAKDVSADEALDYVLGYTVGNDVSARHWQKALGGGQWVRGKSFDTFCPLGPELVTTDELTDPQSVRVSTTLNGEVMQEASTSDMIFPVAELIEFLSQGTTLLPGTVILTGTPSGVGAGREPKVFLKEGDRVTVAIDAIGELGNPVIAASAGH